MKKTIFLSLLLLCTSGVVVGFVGLQNDDETDLLLNNVEALARSEEGGDAIYWLTTKDETKVEQLSCGGTITHSYCHIICLSDGNQTCQPGTIHTITEDHTGHYHAR